MRILNRPIARHAAAACLILLATACATAPSRYGDAGGDLRLCPGPVSNAPAVDRNGNVDSFSPFAVVRGRMIARAPVAACVSSGFGPRRGGAGSFHDGVDLYTGSPAPVAAGGDGVIISADSMRGYGRTVVIDHGRGVSTRYAHLSSYASGVRRGARVRQGEIIGRTGETGNATAVHLHYEVRVDGRAVNPLTVGD